MEKSYSIFIANDPIRLLDEHAEKGRSLERLINDLSSRHLATKREVVIYEGIEGIARSTEYALKQTKDGPVYVLGGNDIIETSGLLDFFRKYHEKRIKRQIPMYLLFSPSTDKKLWNIATAMLLRKRVICRRV